MLARVEPLPTQPKTELPAMHQGVIETGRLGFQVRRAQSKFGLWQSGFQSNKTEEVAVPQAQKCGSHSMQSTM
jgi:hypothetical protein